MDVLERVVKSEMAGGEGGRWVMSISHGPEVDHMGERAGHLKSHPRGLPIRTMDIN